MSQQQSRKRGRDSDDEQPATGKKATQESEGELRVATHTGHIGKDVRNGSTLIVKLEDDLGELEIPPELLVDLQMVKLGEKVKVDFSERQEVPFQLKGVYILNAAGDETRYVG